MNKIAKLWNRRGASWPSLVSYPKRVLRHVLERHGWTKCEDAHINPEAEGAHLNPEAEGAQVNPEAEGAHINPEADGAHINPGPQGAHINPEAQGAIYNTDTPRAVAVAVAVDVTLIPDIMAT